jgi:glutaredoxin
LERKRIAALLLTGVALVLFTGAAHAQVYKWKDAKGVIHFSDTPPAAKGDAVEVKGYSGGPANAALPFELAQAVRAHPVTLYTAAGCAPCDQGRAMLKKRGIPFAEKTIANNDDQQKLTDAGGEGQLPLLVVGHTKLTGFSAPAWSEALNNASYPAQNLLPQAYQYAAATPAAPRGPSPLALAQAHAAERAAAAAAEAEEKAKFAPKPRPVNATPDFQF